MTQFGWTALLALAPYVGSYLDAAVPRRGGTGAWRALPFLTCAAMILGALIWARGWAHTLSGLDQRTEAAVGLLLGAAAFVVCLRGALRWSRRRRGVIVMRWWLRR